MFPDISEGKKIAIAFSGNITSTMAAVLAVEKYGKDNVVLLFAPSTSIDALTQTTGHVAAKHQNRKDVQTQAFTSMADELGIDNRVMLLEYNDYDYGDDNAIRDRHRVDRIKMYIDIMAVKGYDVEKLVMCNPKLSFEIRSLLAMDRNENGVMFDIDTDGVKSYVESHPQEFPEVIAHNVLDSYRRWAVSSIFYRFDETLFDVNNVVFPFQDITEKQIVAMFHDKGLDSLLGKTKSCDVSIDHCGECRNCFQREVALS